MVIVETTVFMRQVHKLLSDEEYRQLQIALIIRPDMGVIIRGGGGLRKMRWRSHGRGKRGGARVIYYWAVEQNQLLLLLMYPKNAQEDLTPAQLKMLRQAVEAEYS
jgi:mRNA-degrading endonuclease RelE of RelBE toxin-antitoxin system